MGKNSPVAENGLKSSDLDFGFLRAWDNISPSDRINRFKAQIGTGRRFEQAGLTWENQEQKLPEWVRYVHLGKWIDGDEGKSAFAFQ